MKVAYSALDRNGISVTDTLEAPSIPEAVEALRRDGYFVTDIQQASGREKRYRGSERVVPVEAGRLRISELLFFTRQMAMLLRSGSPVVPALHSIALQLRGPGRALLDRIRQDMEQGRALAESLGQFKKTFPPVYVSVVRAGEVTASLAGMFERLAAWLKYRREIRNRLVYASVYPALLVALSMSIISAMIVFVLPRFEVLFNSLGTQLPASTKLLFKISSLVREHWVWLIGAALVLVVAFCVVLRSDRGRRLCANLQTRLPWAGRLFARLLQAQLFRTMGLLLQSSVGILETVRLSSHISGNRDFQTLCETMQLEVERGGMFSHSLQRSKMISPSIAQAVSTGEQCGHLDQALLFVAEVLDDENSQMVNMMTKLLEPIILIGMGLLVGGIALSLFIPMFDLAATAG